MDTMEAMAALHQIVAADRKAREELARAQHQSQTFDSKRDILCREMEEQAMAVARREVAAARSKAHTDAKNAIAGLKEQYERDLAALTGRYEAHKDETAERMFRMVIGLDD